MYRNPDDMVGYRERDEDARNVDYAHPEYYQTASEQTARSAQTALPRDTAIANSDRNSDSINYTDAPIGYLDSSYSLYTGEPVQAYRGPESVEGYTRDVGVEQREAAQGENAEKSSKRKGGLAGIGSILLAIGGWLAKLKGLVIFLKFGTLGFSALLSIVVYSFIFGWPFAIGLVVMLFIHEMGHAVVMKLKGIPIGGMIFIPMLGAAVTMRQMPRNARDEAEVGIAGPIAGALAAAVCLFLAQLQPHAQTLWAPLAYFGFFINLFNLIPIVPFDGGRVLAAIDRRVWIIGFLGLLAYQIWSWMQGNTSLWLLFFVVMAALQLWTRGVGSNSAAEREYYNVPTSSRVFLTVLYFGLAIMLFLGMSIAHGLMPIAQ